EREENVEKIKNTIGNIVILDMTRNTKNDDKSFSQKKDNFINTGIGIHQYILEKTEWNEQDINELTERYIGYACKVFSFK
ncbi:HNH endonuclease, partial [Salmonella enterica subsp. enterica serovar Ohio]|nr:HNH endonuclease [Salmonella enterica subsp. enterica serovar Ohio]EHK4738194.1 HNH endonuclease [Salmonella enterica subsp. enterica serovar Ohio]